MKNTKLTQRLAYSQLKTNRKRTIWTLLGIALSTAMITAVYGFGASGYDAVINMIGGNESLRTEYLVTIVVIGVILSVIIVSASVIVVSNSFRVSAGERLTQFGILKSIGATKQQIAKTIMNESVILSAIGIPLGIIIGLLVQLMGIEIANYLLGDFSHLHSDSDELIFNFVIAWQAMLGSIAVAFITVLLSAWLPARKAAKIPAIDAIRGVGEVKIKRSQVKVNWLVKTLFRFEGTLAYKSLKRSRRNFRATVVSLTISIVLFVGASSFGDQLNRMANLVINPLHADVIGEFNSSMITIEREDGSVYSRFEAISNEDAERITAKLREFPDTTVLGVGINGGRGIGLTIPVHQSMFTTNMRDHLKSMNRFDVDNPEYLWLAVALATVDAENYAELTRLAGVEYGSNILINYFRGFIDGRWTEFPPLVFNEQTLTVHDTSGGIVKRRDMLELTLHGELTGNDIPNELLHMSRGHILVVVPEIDSGMYHWFAESDDPRAFTEYARTILEEVIPQLDGDIYVNVNVHNLAAQGNLERNIIRLVMIFVYGFVGMLTLIGMTNVISTISTNVRSRSREFAVLRSVGMTHGGLNRMLNLESILSSAKSLIIGIPLGIGASYLVYQAMMHSVYFAYEFPWIAVAQSILAVFVITWVTMRYAVARLRGKSIVGTIRSDSGM